MKNLMVMFTSFVFSQKYPFFGQFGQKNQNFQIKVKLDTYTNSNIQNSMVVFSFFDFDQKCPFRTDLVQNVEAVSLK